MFNVCYTISLFFFFFFQVVFFFFKQKTAYEIGVRLVGSEMCIRDRSCTGGMLSARLTNVPGVSEVFKQGFVAYSNRAKRKLLDVKKNTLKTYGAVSEKTAKEMAKNGAFITGSDICVSITGLAGPDGGTETTPVGLVYIACAYQNELRIREFHFKGNRQKIRELSTVNALTLLRSCILEKETAGK